MGESASAAASAANRIDLGRGKTISTAIPPIASITQVEGSGTTTAMPAGCNPVISEAFTVAPEVVYSPTVPLEAFATNRFPPDTAMPSGKLNPETSEAFTVAPVVASYSPIVLLTRFATNKFPPD